MAQKLKHYHEICFNPPAFECEAQEDLVAQVDEIHNIIRISHPFRALDPWRKMVFINKGTHKAVVTVCSTYYPMR